MVGPGTPAGEWFRRYWMVAGTSRDLYDIPQAVRLLGEDLVLFRDSNGKIGLVGQNCPHRGTSLEYGEIEDGGIRCPYHGWLFNIHGQCLEMPGEPKDSKFTAKVKHLAYPVKELGGLIFAYMGPDQDNPPPLPKYKAWLIQPVRDHWRRPASTITTGSISSRTARIRCTFRLFIATMPMTAHGAAGFSIFAMSRPSMRWKRPTA